jgi:sarcosine reductase
MELQLSYYQIVDIRFSKETKIEEGVLYLNKEELKSYLLSDLSFSDIEIEITHPGDMTRIINVLDIVDPRKKVNQDQDVYPGWFNKIGIAGVGRTNIIRNISVVETGYKDGFFGGVIDMGGFGSFYSPYSKTHNVVLVPTPSKEMNSIQYAKSLKMASLKASVYLGKTTLNLPPEETVTINFMPWLNSDRRLGLPRVGYIWHMLSHYRLREIYYYGANSNNFYPILITPNEIFDGAVISGHYDHSPALKNYTQSILNHPIVIELCKRHGKEIDFAGIILANEPSDTEGKKWNALISTKIAKSILDLDGVIITKEGGGHTDFDLMEVCKQCEYFGIKTALIDIEMLDPAGEGDYPLVVFEKEANAIVSSGNLEECVSISEMEKVVGGEGMKELGGDPKKANQIPFWLLSGAISEIGMSRIRGAWF